MRLSCGVRIWIPEKCGAGRCDARCSTFRVLPYLVTVAILLSSLSLLAGSASAIWAWETVAPSTNPDVGSAESYNGSIYMIGQWVQVYDPGTDSWTVKRSAVYGYRGGSTIIGDRIYIVDSWTNALYYNITTDSFVDVINPPTTRLDYAVAQYGGIVYVLGGWLSGDPTSVKVVEAYNPANNTWWAVAPMLVGRKNYQAVEMGGYIYAISGLTGAGFGNATNTVERYDPTTNTWTLVSSTNGAHRSFGATVHRGKIVVGGSQFSEVYLPRSDRWVVGPPISISNYFDNELASAGDYVYSVGGRIAAGSPYNTTLRWDLKEPSPPSVSAIDSPDPQFPGGTVWFNATAVDNRGVASVWIRISYPNGSDMGNYSMTFNKTRGDWEYSAPFSELGTYVYEVWAEDVSENWATFSGTFTIAGVPDVLPPSVSVADVPDPQVTGGTVWFNATITDNVAVLGASINITDPQGFDVGNYTMTFNGASGFWEYSAQFTILGTYQYAVWASDTSNNHAKCFGDFTIVGPPDVTRPTVSAVDGPDPQIIGGTVWFNATATDDVAVSSVFVHIVNPGGSDVGNYSMIFDSSDGEWKYSASFSVLGNYTYAVWANDTSDNFANASGTFTIVSPPDLTPPTVNVVDGPDPQVPGGPVWFNATVTDDVGVSSASIHLFDPLGSDIGNNSMTFNAGSGFWEYSSSFSGLGTYSYIVWSNDTSDNWASDSGAFTIANPPDTQPPLVVNNRLNGSLSKSVARGELVAVTAEVDDSSSGNSRIIEAWLTVDGGPFVDMFPTDGAFDSPAENVNATIDTSGWMAGAHTICEYGKDEAGNTGSVAACNTLTVTIPVVNSPPVAVIAVTPSSTGFMGDVFTFDGSESSDPDGSVVSWSWDFGDGDNAAGATVTHAFASKLTFTITLNVTDNLGAWGSTTVQVLTANRAPTIVSASPASYPVSVKVGHMQAFSVVAIDPDGDVLTFSWRVDGIAEGVDSPFHNFSRNGVRTYRLNVTVSDGFAEVWREWSVEVASEPPQENGIPVWLIPAIVIIVVAVALILFFLWRRRRKPEGVAEEASETKETGA